MRRPRMRGYTLLEVVVALALLSLLLLLAGRLLVASRRMEASVAAVAGGPRVTMLGTRLRRDLEEAAAVPGSGGAWSSLALHLNLPDGTVVEYDFDGADLSRRALRPDGSRWERVVAHGLRSFKWRSMIGGAVDVKITFTEPQLGERTPARAGDAVWWLRVAPRGAGVLRRW